MNRLIAKKMLNNKKELEFGCPNSIQFLDSILVEFPDKLNGFSAPPNMYQRI